MTVRIESSNPLVALVGPHDSTTPGEAFIEVDLVNGQTQVSYKIQGVEGATGTVTITATAAGFIDGTGAATIVAPALQISGLTSSKNTSSVDDPFQVQVGVPNAANTLLASLQRVRAGGSVLTAAITNSDASVGQLVTTAATGQAVTVEIPPGVFRSPFGVGAGGVDFDTLGAGNSTVAATIPGFTPTAAASVVVDVAP